MDAITEWDNDTKLKGIEMIDLSKENEKCSTGKLNGIDGLKIMLLI